MAATLGANPGEREDGDYQQALHFFHLGQWQEAITAIEGLRLRYPGDPRLERMLQDARFKANLDAQATVREKRWIIPWRAILLRMFMVVVVVAMVAIGFSVIQWRVLPMISAMQVERQQTILLGEAQSLLKASDLGAAEQKYLFILEKYPDLEAAQTGLATVKHEQELFSLYSEAVAAEQAGEDEEALKLYSQLQIASPNYRDAGTRILGIRHRGDLAVLYDRAVTLEALGLEPEAIDALFQIQSLDVNYQQDQVRELLHALNLKQGQRIINATPAEPSRVAQALDYFDAALEQQPNDAATLTEKRLAVGFINGRDAYNAQNWIESASRLRTVFNERNNYLDGTVANLLYQALVNLGDQLVNDDLLAAYEQPGLQPACSRSRGGLRQSQRYHPAADPHPDADVNADPGADPAACSFGNADAVPDAATIGHVPQSHRLQVREPGAARLLCDES
jgi:hypothetical protein